MITMCCGAPVVRHLPPYGEPRCSSCGHRMSLNGIAPVESRRRPPWTWPLELAGRYLARHS